MFTYIRTTITPPSRAAELGLGSALSFPQLNLAIFERQPLCHRDIWSTISLTARWQARNLKATKLQAQRVIKETKKIRAHQGSYLLGKTKGWRWSEDELEVTGSHDINKSVTPTSVKWKNESENQTDRHCDKSKRQTSQNQQITIIATFIVITVTFSFTLWFFFSSKSMSCFVLLCHTYIYIYRVHLRKLMGEGLVNKVVQNTRKKRIKNKKKERGCPAYLARHMSNTAHHKLFSVVLLYLKVHTAYSISDSFI